MLINTLNPFHFYTYKKKAMSDESKIALLTSYSCIENPFVLMAGVMIDGQLEICKKTLNGHCNIRGQYIKIKKTQMKLEDLINNFKESFGLDFIVLGVNNLYFLITRQSMNKVNIYMTNEKEYVDAFTNINKLFKNNTEVVQNYKSLFTTAGHETKTDNESDSNEVEKQEIGFSEFENVDEKKGFEINMEEPISDDEFEKMLEENLNFASIKFGNLEKDQFNLVRHPIKKVKSDKFKETLENLENSNYDYVEINSSIKILGYRKEDENKLCWFGVLPNTPFDEHIYIKEMIGVFSKN